MARPECISLPRGEAGKIAAGQMESSKHSGFSRLSFKPYGPLAYSRYNVGIYRRSMCLRYGAAQPLRSNLFRSFPASRYRTVAERVMDVGASLLRETYETRGAPLRSSASDVGHFIHRSPSPPPSVPRRPSSSPTPPPSPRLASSRHPFGSGFSITRTNLPSTWRIRLN